MIKTENKPTYKFEEMRREIGANSDGSLGAWGGKKYEGLGVRDVQIFVIVLVIY